MRKVVFVMLFVVAQAYAGVLPDGTVTVDIVARDGNLIVITQQDFDDLLRLFNRMTETIQQLKSKVCT